jgi:hypothetical protein
MAGYVFTIDVLGNEEIESKLRAMGGRAILAEPAMHAIVHVLQDSEVALWSRGRSWESNAAATIARKGRNDPLVRSGALRRSLTEDRDPNQLVEINPDSVKFGSKLWYGHFALGTTKQPKREVIKLRVSDRARIGEIVRQWILHGEGFAGLA